jgi:hypothetical protein
METADPRVTLVAEVLYRQWNGKFHDIPFAEANTEVIDAFMTDAEELLRCLAEFDCSQNPVG